MDYLTVDEWEKIHSGDYRTFNEVLSRIHNSAVETALKMTPEVTAQLIKSSLAVQKVRDKFFDDNPEFLKHKDIVQKAVQETEAANPGADYKKILLESTPLIKRKISALSYATEQLGLFNENRPDLKGALELIGGTNDSSADKKS